MELYVEDFLHREGMRGYDPSYQEIDIYDERGFDDYKEFDEHQDIQSVLKQFAMIDPYKIMKTFGATTETEQRVWSLGIPSSKISQGQRSTEDSSGKSNEGILHEQPRTR